ncbi:phosphatidylserine decarboxylase family protein [Pedobacter flavus]|uniref:Phosphatidylserine decarboxylase proenzyme n=1 Tax=Pedobacter flavus TaxID=3113906 RepID=A0ABU7GZK1_9SPHI|nr:phosphatidylserine decarboxylase family protein [Pedobacter sp. VNH31]MEE1884430.1 phosphatidylserine decarboxylase family protein [Pedobacter sp. VNH31]
MTIHKEGYTTIALTVLFIFILNAFIDYKFGDLAVLRWIFYVLTFALFVIVLQFFRNPKREFNRNDAAVISPADGKVVVIEETEEGEYFKDKRLQVSIFMSPINVHINRYPVSGTVKFFKYHPGKYLAAWNPKSSTENERTTTVVETANGTPVLFRQIAGALARRIVWYVKEDDKATQTQEFGFIKFGSRVDLFFPIGTKVKVELGQVVKGGITEIADLV